MGKQSSSKRKPKKRKEVSPPPQRERRLELSGKKKGLFAFATLVAFAVIVGLALEIAGVQSVNLSRALPWRGNTNEEERKARPAEEQLAEDWEAHLNAGILV